MQDAYTDGNDDGVSLRGAMKRTESNMSATSFNRDSPSHADAYTTFSPGKNLSLFANSNLNLPNFGTDGSASKSGSKGKNRAPSYTAAPDEFLNDYLSGTANSAAPSRRRSANASGMAAALAGAVSPAAGTPEGVLGLEESDSEEEDLTPTQVAALDLLDLIDSHTTAVKAAEIILSINLEALKSPYVLAQMSKKLAPFPLEKYAEAHFQYDRRANSNSSTLHTHPVDKLITFQSDLLKTPLTAMPTPTMAADAVACFRIINTFMGSASKASGLQQIDLAVNLLLKLITAPPEFHDEIYCQICKQTRKNPTVESLELGWQLMLLCLSTIPPSKRLLPYLIHYISTSLSRLEQSMKNSISAPASASTAAAPFTELESTAKVASGDENVLKFVIVALRTVVPAAAACVRTEIPTRAEIRALLLGESMEISVFTMVHGLHHKFAVNSYTNVSALLALMCDQLQLQESNRKIFALYEVAAEDDATHSGTTHHHGHHAHHSDAEVEMNPDERVLDWLSRCQRALLNTTGAYQAGSVPYNYNYHLGVSGDEQDRDRVAHNESHGHLHSAPSAVNVHHNSSHRLMLRAKYMFRIADHAHDAVAMDLLYAQAHADVLNARYMHTAADAIVLAAFMLQELCGDYISGTRTLSELKGKSITLSKVISKSLLDQGNITRHEFEGRIFTAYKTLAGVTKENARRMYLSYISCWKIFGATFFIVSGQVNNFTEIVLSVSANSILLLNPVSMHFLAEYKYSDIYSWGHSFDSFVLIIGSKSSQSKSYFKTTQGKEIDGLVRIYHDHYMATEHTTQGAVCHVNMGHASSNTGGNTGGNINAALGHGSIHSSGHSSGISSPAVGSKGKGGVSFGHMQ